MKPRLRKIGESWLCQSRDGVVVVGLSPVEAFAN